ncbi:Nramp family divalent metal transporter [Fulvivirgaceae bacterium BMA12]|uniref:Nramp family divalent metal transporter n=1 Tax=Agaribacillus aureus TaxID=3051825 RepID=A0ABT8L2W2_9BACT|nr:Nramp family divalent metal transporter [Fulvivirgaceae bacterium BMA12]
MAPGNNFKSRLSSALFWSVVSAAFIGPGTVTTASNAGANYGYSLLWALIFSTIACIILQEAAARITLISGLSLGEAIAKRYKNSKGLFFKYFIFLSILIGGIAYQAGNILGAIAGLQLLFGFDTKIVTGIISLLCAFLLWFGNYKIISNLLGMVVAFMGFVFVFIAFNIDLDWYALLKGAFIPVIPDGAAWVVIGLIGTTIVPYNLFLASGISAGQEMNTMRFGIVSAILLGGLVSAAILLAGTTVAGDFSFESLKTAMESKSGSWSGYLLGVGLFSAGFTSAVTAPLAAAITAKSLFHKDDDRWQENKKFYNGIWLLVIVAGFLFGVAGVKPIPAIILAQVINGLLLPVACIFLVIIVNDSTIIPGQYLNSGLSNYLLLAVVLITTFLGLNNIFKATLALFNLPNHHFSVIVILCISVAITIAIAYYVRKIRIGVKT